VVVVVVMIRLGAVGIGWSLSWSSIAVSVDDDAVKGRTIVDDNSTATKDN